jgi:GNAT superfamily N-acetyltransferase
MIDYLMMDESRLLCRCLHDGPVPLEEAGSPEGRPLAVESEAHLPPGTVGRFLRAVCRAYGSCGVLAVDGDAVVGKARFYPQEIAERFYPALCLQEPQRMRVLATFDPDVLPPKDELRERALFICCFQLVHDYKAAAEGRATDVPSYLGRGIATNMLRILIDWARAEGWDELRAEAVEPIPPLLMWSGRLSVERYRKLGFRAALSPSEKVEGAIHQRRGYHGEAMRKMWEPYAHVSDAEATRVYDVSLRLASDG